MVLISKRNENSYERSYKLSLYANPGFFGDGSDGALTISANTTQAPTDSACTGTSGSYSLSATNVSFAASQKILIIQMYGTGAGTYQINTISSYTAGTITLQDALNATYVTGAQVLVLQQYSGVTVNAGITWTAKAWTGTVGGILAFLCNGTVTVNGAITAAGKGFTGGSTSSDGAPGQQGNSATGTGTTSVSANGTGGGGGDDGDGAAAGGGGGAGHGASGTYRHFAVTWDASASTAILYVDAVAIGTATGALTAIYDGTALLALAADYNSGGTTRSFFDGLMDEVRVWNDIRTATEISSNKSVEIATNSANLQAYYQLDNSASDSTANANNLTLRNSPTYSTTVPFSHPTTRLDKDQEDTSTGNTYAVPQAIDEGASHRQTFVPTKDPQKSISVDISDTGDDSDWTLTVHDALNRTVATKTVVHADLVTGDFEFIFSTPWTPVIGASYHFHLVASTATGTPLVVAGTSNNLETAQFVSYYQFLVTDEDYHPIEQILNLLAFGNGRYVATYDGASYDPHALTLPSGYKVRCLAKWREYLAIGTWKGDSVESYDDSIIFFWDGFSETYNFYISVPQGAVNAMLGSQGTLYFVAGYKGDLLEYTGGDKASKVKRLPGIGVGEQIEIMPGALTMWQTLLRIGAGVTDSSTIEQGVYTWGSLNINYPDSLSYDHTISTGNSQNSNIKIGMLLPVEEKLLIGWKDNVSYGLDVIDPAGDLYPTGSVEFRIRDEDVVWKEKIALLVRADFEPLNSGESVGLQYKLDRESSWSTEQVITSASDATDRNRLQIAKGRHREYQVRVNLATSVSTSPNVLGVVVDEDINEREETL